jgi:hypothetical protein
MIKFNKLFPFTSAGSIEEIYPGQTGIEKCNNFIDFDEYGFLIPE